MVYNWILHKRIVQCEIFEGSRHLFLDRIEQNQGCQLNAPGSLPMLLWHESLLRNSGSFP